MVAGPTGPQRPRVRALLRRASFRAQQPGPKHGGNLLRFSGWKLDLARRRLEAPDGMLIGLTSGEYEMLVVFAEHAGRVLRPPVPFDPGWRPVLFLMFVIIGFSALRGISQLGMLTGFGMVVTVGEFFILYPALSFAMPAGALHPRTETPRLARVASWCA